MATKKRALGRGLDALLGTGADQSLREDTNEDLLKSIPIDML